jgi:hypothetical protein
MYLTNTTTTVNADGTATVTGTLTGAPTDNILTNTLHAYMAATSLSSAANGGSFAVGNGVLGSNVVTAVVTARWRALHNLLGGKKNYIPAAYDGRVNVR